VQHVGWRRVTVRGGGPKRGEENVVGGWGGGCPSIRLTPWEAAAQKPAQHAGNLRDLAAIAEGGEGKGLGRGDPHRRNGEQGKASANSGNPSSEGKHGGAASGCIARKRPRKGASARETNKPVT